MQNVMVWVINDDFRGDHWRYAGNLDKVFSYLKLQVENSLNLGWKKEDIIIITNFDFSYMGVNAYKIDTDICKWSSFANKLTCVNKMIKFGVIKEDFWLHDTDAFQLLPFEFPSDCKDWGYTRHDPRRDKPQGGSGFFRKSGFDIVDKIASLILITKVKREEKFLPLFFKEKGENRTKKLEESILSLSSNTKNASKIKTLKEELECGRDAYGKFGNRFSFLNYTYDLCMARYFSIKYPKTELPVKVIHFHPEYESCSDCFILGKNRLNTKVTTLELDNLLEKYNLYKKE